MNAKNFLGHTPDWMWVMKKIASPLGMSSFAVSNELGLMREWEYPAPFLSHLYHYEDVHADKEEVQVIRSFIFQLINEDQSYPDRMAQRVKVLAEKIENHIYALDPKASLRDCIEVFKKESDLFIHMVNNLSFRGPIPIADVLDERVQAMVLLRLGEKGMLEMYPAIKEITQSPSRESIVLEEQNYILSHKEKIKTNEAEVIREYRKKFESMQFHWFVGHNLTDEEILKRFEQNFPEQEDQKDFDLNEYFNKSEIKTINQLREWVYLRTAIKDMVNLAAYKLLPILNLIAEKRNVPAEYMPFFSYYEILGIEKMSREELERKYLERRDGYSAQIDVEGFKIGDFNKPQENIQETTVIKGNSAYKGFVTGKVKVMKSPRDDFGDADILVVGMTTPDYLPNMKKAKAFVTDEGGITCHAAIVAREMKKPCVIGTKIATKVLKDGDTVEVDAEKGVVRIIK